MSDPNNSSSSVSSVAPVESDSPRRPYDLSKFRLKEILNNNSGRKSVCCLGYFTDLSEVDEALILFEKTAFAKKHLGGGADEQDTNTDHASNTGFFSSSSQLRETFVNDIYGNFECFPNPEINSNFTFRWREARQILSCTLSTNTPIFFCFHLQTLRRPLYIQQPKAIFSSIQHTKCTSSARHQRFTHS